jgi:membrane-bound inhibitor of C-type lysozyme
VPIVFSNNAAYTRHESSWILLPFPRYRRGGLIHRPARPRVRADGGTIILTRALAHVGTAVLAALAGVACGPGGASEDPSGAIPTSDGDAVATPEPEPASGLPTLTAHAWQCEGDYVVTKLEPGGDLFVFLPGGTRRLSQVRAASGARYADSTVSFWNRGAEARLERNSSSVICTENRRASLVEDAKLRGMDFRGTGNEPPWVLEMGPDGITVYTGYESLPHAFPPVDPIDDEMTGGSRWDTRDADGRVLTVTISPGPCVDSMADLEFESTVRLDLDGLMLNGCGQALH